jgi:hypothetical protein
VRNHPRADLSAMRGKLVACAFRFKPEKQDGRSVDAPAVVRSI